ncbi:hypothetical protein [uncultured Victivallis sp.]|nr:hypothetical protein [uncultured Victivallis sp.]
MDDNIPFSSAELERMNYRICEYPNCDCGKLTVISPPGFPPDFEIDINIHERKLILQEEDAIVSRFLRSFYDKLGETQWLFLQEKYQELKEAQALAHPGETVFRFPESPKMYAIFEILFPFVPRLVLKLGEATYPLSEHYFQADDEQYCLLTSLQDGDEESFPPIYVKLNAEPPEFHTLSSELEKVSEEQFSALLPTLQEHYNQARSIFEAQQSDWAEIPEADDDDDEPIPFDEDFIDPVQAALPVPVSGLHPDLAAVVPLLSGKPDETVELAVSYLDDDCEVDLSDRTRIRLEYSGWDDDLEWRVPSLRALFRGDRQPPDMSKYPDEYLNHFAMLEKNLLSYCHASFEEPADREIQEVYSAVRRRPDGRPINELRNAVWQAAALMLGAFPCSQPEFEAILLKLEQSARTFALGHTSRNYLTQLKEQFCFGE